VKFTSSPVQRKWMIPGLVLLTCMLIIAPACNDPSLLRASANDGGASTPSSSSLNWVRYTDSAEGAFSIDVPMGWQVQGGMYRFGYFDVRWMIDLRSLDGKVIARISDANVPPYALPGPRTGREGQPYTKPQQFQMVISSYKDGQSYAELYAKHRFADVCKNMTPRQNVWKPTIPAAWKPDPSTKSSEGVVAYDCNTSDGPRIATVYAATTLYPSSAFWVVTPVSVITTPDRASAAHAVVQHMMDSWQKNPQWAQYQDQMTKIGLDQIRAGFQQFMRQMQAYHQERTAAMNQQVASFEAHQNAQARQVSQWGEILTGLQSVTDPQTGEHFQVFSGPKSNYYVNGLGVKVNSNISPGPDFHELIPTQPE
jgi:hypothetical protein